MSDKAADLIEALAAESRALRDRTILAPIVEGKQAFVHVLIDGQPYRLRVRRPRPGWWLLRPSSDLEADIVGTPLPWQLARYLRDLPAIRVVAVHRLSRSAWLVYPWNAGDAHQRRWPSASSERYVPKPRALHLVAAPAVRPFDVLVARALGGLLLFDDYDRRTFWAPLAERLLSCLEEREWETSLPGMTAELRAVLSLHHHRFLLEEKRRLEEEAAELRKTLEGRLHAALGYSGARLRAWTERGQGYEVVWEMEGEEYRTVVRPDLFVESAGICLSGRDSDYNITAIVHVLRMARRRR